MGRDQYTTEEVHYFKYQYTIKRIRVAQHMEYYIVLNSIMSPSVSRSKAPIYHTIYPSEVPDVDDILFDTLDDAKYRIVLTSDAIVDGKIKRLTSTVTPEYEGGSTIITTRDTHAFRVLSNSVVCAHIGVTMPTIAHLVYQASIGIDIHEMLLTGTTTFASEDGTMHGVVLPLTSNSSKLYTQASEEIQFQYFVTTTDQGTTITLRYIPNPEESVHFVKGIRFASCRLGSGEHDQFRMDSTLRVSITIPRDAALNVVIGMYVNVDVL